MIHCTAPFDILTLGFFSLLRIQYSLEMIIAKYSSVKMDITANQDFHLMFFWLDSAGAIKWSMWIS